MVVTSLGCCTNFSLNDTSNRPCVNERAGAELRGPTCHSAPRACCFCQRSSVSMGPILNYRCTNCFLGVR